MDSGPSEAPCARKALRDDEEREARRSRDRRHAAA